MVGEARAERTDSTFALIRYNPSGSLDTSFGRVMTNVTSKSDNAIGVELQADGKIVVAGSAAYGDGSDGKFVVARYDASDLAGEGIDAETRRRHGVGAVAPFHFGRSQAASWRAT